MPLSLSSAIYIMFAHFVRIRLRSPRFAPCWWCNSVSRRSHTIMNVYCVILLCVTLCVFHTCSLVAAIARVKLRYSRMLALAANTESLSLDSTGAPDSLLRIGGYFLVSPPPHADRNRILFLKR